MSIANKLKQEGWEVSLFVSNKNMLSINFVNLIGIKILSAISLVNILKSSKDFYFNLTIVDGYDIKNSLLKKIKLISKKIFLIDDLANKKRSCDYLLDMSPGRKSKDYKDLVSSKTKLLLGEKFLIIKDVFFRKIIETPKIKVECKNILINMGSTDVQNITLFILKVILKFSQKYKILFCFHQKVKI